VCPGLPGPVRRVRLTDLGGATERAQIRHVRSSGYDGSASARVPARASRMASVMLAVMRQPFRPKPS